MKIQVKMLGDLRHYLPAGAQFNRCEVDVSADANAESVLDKIQLPGEKAFLLMLNGDMVPKADYRAVKLKANDEVVLFPPIKGG